MHGANAFYIYMSKLFFKVWELQSFFIFIFYYRGLFVVTGSISASHVVRLAAQLTRPTETSVERAGWRNVSRPAWTKTVSWFCSSNAHAQPLSRSRDVTVARLRIYLAWAFAVRLCAKYFFYMSLLKCRSVARESFFMYAIFLDGYTRLTKIAILPSGLL